MSINSDSGPSLLPIPSRGRSVSGFQRIDQTHLQSATCRRRASGIQYPDSYRLGDWWIAHVNVVALRRARLILAWVIVRWYMYIIFVTQPGHPYVGRCIEPARVKPN